MNKPSERIVIFVTPAQKRAISASAGHLGISVSELMRRAVLSFGATSEQVKAASIVDRLNAPRAPDPLNATLQRIAAASQRRRARAGAAHHRGGPLDEPHRPAATPQPDVQAAAVPPPATAVLHGSPSLPPAAVPPAETVAFAPPQRAAVATSVPTLHAMPAPGLRAPYAPPLPLPAGATPAVVAGEPASPFTARASHACTDLDPAGDGEGLA